MLPPLSDPRWASIVKNPDAYKSKMSSLATKMMLGALKIKAQREPLDKLVKHAYDFFKQNEKMAAKDINALFK